MQLPSLLSAAQLKAMAQLAAQAPEGGFAEIGVFQGGSAQVLYEVALRQQRDLHLFDTFSGMPVYTEGLDKHKIDAEFAAPQAVKNIRNLMPLAYVHVGVYPDTHPKDLKDVAFVHVDCDQYESYCAVFAFMWPQVVSGGIMLFDDYPYLEGAKLAVDTEFPPQRLRRCHHRYYVVK